MRTNTTNMKTFAAADGLKLAYYIDDFTDPWRTPDTLLLLHAAMGSALRWFNWVPRLARRYRVVRLDLRGHGNSTVPAPEQPFSLAHLVGDALQLLDLVGAGSVHIVGSGFLGRGRRARSLASRRKASILSSSISDPKLSTLHKWRRALEAAGVEFIDPDAKSDEGGAGVRLRGAKARR
jgi:pimeloyl-ACP methyl ester carboxylesterase